MFATAQNAMTNDQLMRVAPSIFAATAWEGVSDRYAFIPTIVVIEALREEGFVPVKANQSRTRIDGKREFTKHMIRFQHVDAQLDLAAAQRANPGHFFYDHHGITAPEIPQIVLVNSHDRSSGYQMCAGLYRLACSNGLMVATQTLESVKVRHGGNAKDMVIEGFARIVDEMPLVLGHVDGMKSIKLDREEQTIFAAAAMELRYPTDDDGKKTAPIKPADLLTPRRVADRSTDLWTTFNTVQENFVKGGIRGVGTTGRRTHTRAVNTVNEDIRLNKALWTLAEQMRALKA